MYIGYVVRAGESAPEERISNAIKNFNYTDQNVICVGDGYSKYISEVNTEATIRQILKDADSDLDTLLEKYLAYKDEQDAQQQAQAAAPVDATAPAQETPVEG